MTDATDRIPYDTGTLDNSMGVLAIGLAQWEARDETRTQSHVRHAANDAMVAIDAMLGSLYLMRSRLLNEIRAYDEAADARVDALLDERRAAREDSTGSDEESSDG